MTAPASPPAPSGILLVDKPQGITSHDAVSRTRRLAHTRKVGHAGTLDPMATGLLMLGIGSSTRLLTYLVGLDKQYTATIRLGVATTTDDAEGEITETTDASGIEPARVEGGIAALTGEIEQVPSTVSAIKVDGKRAYARARAGETVELRARPVVISEFAVLAPPRPVGTALDVDVRVTCSSGTYIRALARDLGAALGVGGHLTALRRTRVGPFAVEDALPLPERGAELDVAPLVLDPAAVAGALFPTVEVDAETVRMLENGRRVALTGAEASAGPLAVIAPDGHLVGLVSYDGVQARVLVNFPTGS
ncbi:tRNA pseudouridine(55) synthase TruB [Salinibacterium sp. SYSU T00001]|uniref:tRNA pseudouridine(55) synthase TruB n=1 Tax=Homoserinimonas sedimenticola TaxID=2986805 RepID=UPI0022362A93|nr:tRNA pseudouridine(55) synthase TruB [Salinibacterium sedimenticola]MCW4386714.1 tRNA pseudouridine(55) synthase TruB [Salinibacterium sedimenticola]